jgi:RsiW-degrading membrane proteinase PrsW (M82 family)
VSFPLLTPALLCLLPVLGFLALLVFLDSYKLVPLLSVCGLLVGGLLMGGLSYLANAWLVAALDWEFITYTLWMAPPIEEGLKGAVLVWLIRRQRIGFLIDAAIAGFAIGSGFAVLENLYALWRLSDASLSTWFVRGFGTAVMHGGATAAFALIALSLLERDERRGLAALLPGFLVAVLLHAGFNHLVEHPRLATIAVMITVPPLLLGAFQLGERSVGDWLGRGFDADADLLGLMRSGSLPDSPVGKYLASLRNRFSPPVLADLLCYLGLFTELSMRAKGLLLMRENGFAATVDEATHANMAELKYLERNIGVTGLLALSPLLPMRRRVLRQLHAM